MSKLFKPKAPKSLDQATAEGAKIIPHFCDDNFDNKGNRIDRSQQARDRAATVLVLIKGAKAAIAKAEGLPPLAKAQHDYAAAYATHNTASTTLAAMRRKAVGSGEGGSYPGLREAAEKASQTYKALMRAGEVHSAVEAAEKAKAELPALITERDA
ncbi:hypothetical protein M3I54_29455 [Paraburkholderia sp. CNPSo 3274]|uniref:hypothetical protein n=1 Tax=Paraburkholderia sp. CNPSo 3274 TaxID=2940932 RepID=UPI0020B88CDC|nr:hypothetical protein [Paraburkholderia sp. CNPSo 3274]MCP3711056.1 hypothetical protein [Paraburkholderia sp. CNPSo 3274]